MPDDEQRKRKTGELAQVYVLHALHTVGRLRTADLPARISNLSATAAREAISVLRTQHHVAPVTGYRGYWQITEQGIGALRRQQRHID